MPVAHDLTRMKRKLQTLNPKRTQNAKTQNVQAEPLLSCRDAERVLAMLRKISSVRD